MSEIGKRVHFVSDFPALHAFAQSHDFARAIAPSHGGECVVSELLHISVYHFQCEKALVT